MIYRLYNDKNALNTDNSDWVAIEGPMIEEESLAQTEASDKPHGDAINHPTKQTQQ